MKNRQPKYQKNEKYIDINVEIGGKEELKKLDVFPVINKESLSRQARRQIEREEEVKKSTEVLNALDCEVVAKAVFSEGIKRVSLAIDEIFSKRIAENRHYIFELQKAHDNLSEDYSTVSDNQEKLLRNVAKIVDGARDELSKKTDEHFAGIKKLMEQLDIATRIEKIEALEEKVEKLEKELKKKSSNKPDVTLKSIEYNNLTVIRCETVHKAEYVIKNINEKFKGCEVFRGKMNVYTDLSKIDVMDCLSEYMLESVTIVENVNVIRHGSNKLGVKELNE